jgi:hypothetical protein
MTYLLQFPGSASPRIGTLLRTDLRVPWQPPRRGAPCLAGCPSGTVHQVRRIQSSLPWTLLPFLRDDCCSFMEWVSPMMPCKPPSGAMHPAGYGYNGPLAIVDAFRPIGPLSPDIADYRGIAGLLVAAGTRKPSGETAEEPRERCRC